MPPIIPRPQRPHRPDREPGSSWTADQLFFELAWQAHVDEHWNDAVHERIIALEEALISRKARRALRRKIRESAEQFSWAARSFHGRRLEAVSNEYMTRLDERERRSAA